MSRATGLGASAAGKEATGAGTNAGSTAASTSSVVMAPSGPVPLTLFRSTLYSRARRRALGEILAPAEVDGSATGAGAAAARCAGWTARAAEATGAASAGGFSPGATSQAMVWPTGTTSPSCTLMPARMPSPGASTSMTALSVSTSRSGSPLATCWPSFLSQEMSLPVSCHFQCGHDNANGHDHLGTAFLNHRGHTGIDIYDSRLTIFIAGTAVS